jgi:serine protease inhibitor
MLDALGLGEARHSASALRGLAPNAVLSQVIQRTMIDADEEGAGAAAAKGTRALERDDGTIHMVVDKPFIYALRDSVTGLMRRGGADCLVVAMKWGNAHGAKGVGHRR